MDALVNSFIYLQAVLGVALIVFLLRGPFRVYFVLFLYSLVDFLTSLAEIFVSRIAGRNSPLYKNLYWTDVVLLALLLFVLVIVLIRRAADQPALRSASDKILPIVIGAAVLLPYLDGFRPLTHSGQSAATLSGRWFIVAGQVLDFGGAIMNLVLWTALLSSKRRDAQLLTVSAGLGVAVTGQVIYYGIRILMPAISNRFQSFEDLVLTVTHIVGIAIWCWAFRPSAGTKTPAVELR